MIHETRIADAKVVEMRPGNARSAAARQVSSRGTSAGGTGAETERAHVLIVDDDESVRTALRRLMLSVGLDVTCFASTRELLDAELPRQPGCLVLDVRMPGSSGLDLQNHLAAKADAPPIVFLTGHGDIAMTVKAMKAGAVDFLTKPVRDQALLDAVTAGIERDIVRRRAAQLVKKYADRLATLTQRERQVFREVARGRLNKQVAFDLGISEVTVKLHRSNVMRKMQAASVGELIRAWEALPAEVREAGEPGRTDGFGPVLYGRHANALTA